MRTVFRTDGQDRSYTRLANRFLQDKRLSWETRGMLADILSRKANWDINVSGLSSMGKCGRDRVYRLIKEATAAGYMRLDERRNDKGYRVECAYVVSDDPAYLQALPNTFTLNPGNPDPGIQEIGSLNSENPDLENPDLAFATQEIKETKKEKKVRKAQATPAMCAGEVQLLSGEQTAKPEPAGSESTEHAKRKAVTKGSEEFEAAWIAYRKASDRSPGSKPKALKEFGRLSVDDRSVLLDAIAAYAEDCNRQKFGRGERRSMADMDRFFRDFFRQFADDIMARRAGNGAIDQQADIEAAREAIVFNDWEFAHARNWFKLPDIPEAIRRAVEAGRTLMQGEAAPCHA